MKTCDPTIHEEVSFLIHCYQIDSINIWFDLKSFVTRLQSPTIKGTNVVKQGIQVRSFDLLTVCIHVNSFLISYLHNFFKFLIVNSNAWSNRVTLRGGRQPRKRFIAQDRELVHQLCKSVSEPILDCLRQLGSIRNNLDANNA